MKAERELRLTAMMERRRRNIEFWYWPVINMNRYGEAIPPKSRIVRMNDRGGVF
jgi:hypothetical protein